jgi:hypothetical protein
MGLNGYDTARTAESSKTVTGEWQSLWNWPWHISEVLTLHSIGEKVCQETNASCTLGTAIITLPMLGADSISLRSHYLQWGEGGDLLKYGNDDKKSCVQNPGRPVCSQFTDINFILPGNITGTPRLTQ